MNTLNLIKEIWRGKDLYRLLMNSRCANYELSHRVLDLGSGTTLASYHRFFKKATSAEIIPLDLGFEKAGSGTFLDLEKDKLPYSEASIDSILIFNILEHLFNYSLLIAEMKRVIKPGGRVFGAVPFLVGYHPDPQDYWRYTSESLRKIFEAAGFKNIEMKILGLGPFSAAWSQIEFLWPRLLKMLILPMVLGLDQLLIVLRPRLNREKFALGLFFICST